MAEQEELSFNATAIAITEFLEVAIHTILYVRQVYPPDLFVRRKRYDAPVYQSRHPALNEYIAGAVKAVGEELVLGNVERVVVVIKDQAEIPLERFVFSLRNVIEVETDLRDTPVQNAVTAASLPQFFRSFLIKLNIMESQLSSIPLEDNPTFAIVLELRDDCAPSAAPSVLSVRTTSSEEDQTYLQGQDPSPWIPAAHQHTTAGTSENAEVHVVRAVETGVINVCPASRPPIVY
ncbi:hypothetical protein BOTBODRAFT_54600 [Botryobasidium botryosum FD-172 SS1]|uniref:HORMA domain-containing protein n=1 Tax=Botryobasidium botryosum (strain FD-172 SS1) TaxID=930990 RepID=A0A067MJJ1_BOTB1|nr:hypothetical protein BOTBODRAFT_54600 [Botryobasidium botryosum FD-172 SS1]